MARSTSKQFVVSVIFSFMAVAVNYIISLILTPYITENIGTEAYGFVSLAKTFANYASIFTVALNSFSARYISIEYHKGNLKKRKTTIILFFCGSNSFRCDFCRSNNIDCQFRSVLVYSDGINLRCETVVSS